MRRVTLRLFALIVAACAGLSLGLAGFSGQSVPPREAPRTMGNVTLFEGARLIFGDGRSPLEESALLVENNKFTRIGKRGAFQVPNGAVRVDVMGTHNRWWPVPIAGGPSRREERPTQELPGA